MNRVEKLLLTLSVVGASAIAPQAGAIYIRSDRTAAPHNDLAALFPATGYLGTTFGGQSCTATLVGPNQVLTAAHCVDFNSNGIPDDSIGSIVFGLEANVPFSLTANVASVAINPGWVSSNGDAAFDFAVLTLSTPINNIQPALVTSANPVGNLGVAVGYGNQGTGTSSSDPSGSNDKIAVTNIIDRLGSDPFFSNNDTLQFDFDRPNGSTSTFGSNQALDLEGATAPGDSGSPLMAQFGDAWFVTGVLNTGYNNFGFDSRYGDVSLYAPVLTPSNLAFLQGEGVRIITDTTPIVGDANLDYWVGESDLDIVLSNWGQSVTVGEIAGGDLNGDGTVDGTDLDLVVSNWGAGVPLPTLIAAVPEPGSLAFCLLMGGALLRRRR